VHDICVNSTNKIPTIGSVLTKPLYLIILDGFNKMKALKYFISIDKPELLNGFIQVKGFFSDYSEEDIIIKFAELLTNTKKELFLEMYFPWHKIHSMRSLIFKAK